MRDQVYAPSYIDHTLTFAHEVYPTDRGKNSVHVATHKRVLGMEMEAFEYGLCHRKINVK